ncbi:hypothetical protein [Serpentinicella alkaliphila]|uniref:Zn-finger containing protein n=1 Tax=Serpentinicella alkaliphila TaxID=1734049 RepID=A0A4R2TI40_9FIRM|nr:hypothetical protein [Serpentinicella alkaliphila]QUH26452.1 hypothetical protein HZR23_12465 [Serpentinicella alkaliphila]TCQ03270.1 hypothetical protein EDD79_101058 [Serpentinicella alkaliphila]
MDWLRKFMIGRYGQDQLSIFLFVISIVLTLSGQFTGISLLIILGYVPIFIGFYRMFSKDIQKRRMENYKFSIFISPLYSKLTQVKNRIEGSKTHKYFKCQQCNTTLRVHKNKGKIVVTCPKCKGKFTKTT